MQQRMTDVNTTSVQSVLSALFMSYLITLLANKFCLNSRYTHMMNFKILCEQSCQLQKMHYE